MPEQRNVQLLDAVVPFESVAFRVGQVARRLQAEHPNLVARQVICSIYSIAFRQETDVSTMARLEVSADGLDGALAWATALGATAHQQIKDNAHGVYETARCEAVIDGVTVEVSATRFLSADEAAAWHAEQAEQVEDGAS